MGILILSPSYPTIPLTSAHSNPLECGIFHVLGVCVCVCVGVCTCFFPLPISQLRSTLDGGKFSIHVDGGPYLLRMFTAAFVVQLLYRMPLEITETAITAAALNRIDKTIAPDTCMVNFGIRLRSRCAHGLFTQCFHVFFADFHTRDTTMVKIVKFSKMTADAIVPYKSTPGAAGLDLFSAETLTIPARSTAVVGTALRVSMPRNCYGRIAPRYKTSARHSIDVGAGVVDSDYRGELKIVLFNHGDAEFVVKKHARVAQIIFEKIIQPTVVEVDQCQFVDSECGECKRKFV